MLEDLEQPEVSGSNLGKFKDAESLLKAYNSLEAEFTKKSQRLASLEADESSRLEAEEKSANLDKRVDELVTKFAQIKPFTSALKESLVKDENLNLEQEALKLITNSYKSAEDYAKDSEFLNNFIFSNEEIKDKIVKDYLSKITQNSPIKVNNGAITLTPPKTPTTIKEAGDLAKSIIKQK